MIEEDFDDMGGAGVSAVEGECTGDFPGMPLDSGFHPVQLHCCPGAEFLIFQEGQAVRRTSRILVRHMLDTRLRSNLS